MTDGEAFASEPQEEAAVSTVIQESSTANIRFLLYSMLFFSLSATDASDAFDDLRSDSIMVPSLWSDLCYVHYNTAFSFCQWFKTSFSLFTLSLFRIPPTDAASERARNHTVAKRTMGTILKEIDQRNSDGKIQEIQGINIKKQFMPSVADMTGLELKNSNWQFDLLKELKVMGYQIDLNKLFE